MTEQTAPAPEPDNQPAQATAGQPVQTAASEQPVHPGVRDFLVAKLQLARERVTAPELGVKASKLANLDELIVRMNTPSDAPGMGRPTAAELRDALGDPDEADIRHALDEWDVG